MLNKIKNFINSFSKKQVSVFIFNDTNVNMTIKTIKDDIILIEKQTYKTIKLHMPKNHDIYLKLWANGHTFLDTIEKGVLDEEN